MKIAILGATGAIGQQFVKQALARGHIITALVRSPQNITIKDPQLTIIAGDALNPEDVARTVNGQDAIFIALGTGESTKKASIRADGTQQVVNALKASGEKPHVVVLSSLGVGESKQQIGFYLRWLFGYILRHPFADHSKQEAIIRASSLQWTILRPTTMNNEPGKGKAIATTAPNPIKAQTAIARADVAAFALDAIEKPQYSQQSVTLTA